MKSSAHAGPFWSGPAAILIALLCLPMAVSAVGKDKVLYVGGTVEHFPLNAPPIVSIGAPTFEGRLDTKNVSAFVFEGGRWGTLSIPYAAISSIEYGSRLRGHPELTPVYGAEQTAKPPAGLPGDKHIIFPWDPFDQFTDKIHYMLTLAYRDQSGLDQTVVFELGKDLVQTTLQTLQQRSGKAVQFTDVRACMLFKTAEACGVGTPAELRGLKVLAFAPLVPDDSRKRILAEIEQAALGIAVLPDVDGADMVVAYYNGYSVDPGCPCEGGHGEVSVTRDARSRVVFFFTGSKRGVWGKNPATGFGKAFVEAYRAANAATR